MSIRVIRPGLLTTVQDLGRMGMQQYGVIVSGAMDSFALRIANLLVSNEEHEAVLEITLSGPSLLFEHDALIAISGADLSPSIGDQTVPAWRPIWVRAGSQLDFGAPVRGCRAYLSVAGGIDVPLVMHSRSTYLRAKLGGLEGRPLANGDRIPFRSESRQAFEMMKGLAERAIDRPFHSTSWFACTDLPGYTDHPTIRVMPGGQHEWFTEESQIAFVSEEYRVTPQSDRMGYRLSGPSVRFRLRRELISEAVTFGTIQVPADGQPIILMADRPTTGGYAKIAQVATVDLPILAQLKPGSKIRFQQISIDEAQSLYRSREALIQKLRCGIRLMNHSGM
jgi:antagonist of KipI